MFRTALISMFLTSAAFADTWTVDDDGKADFNNIQAAVDASSDGDEILVMPGTYTYTGDQVVDMMGKAVRLHSSDGPEATIIDGEGARRGILCDSGETSKTIVEGFTITDGYTTGNGGGMYNYYSSPTLTDCIFTNNTSRSDGAGMYNNNVIATIENCVFTENTTTVFGSGGGMHNVNSSLTLTNCSFVDNTANADSGNGGGGISNDQSDLNLSNCIFKNNRAAGNYARGGGILSYCIIACNSSLVVTSCVFENNIADNFAGAICTYNSNVVCTIMDTIVCGNTLQQIQGPWIDGGGNCTALSCQDSDGDGLPDKCSSVGDGIHHVPEEYLTIQAAVNAAGAGDEIVIGPGTYTSDGDHVVDMVGKRLWIHSSDGPEVTIIDGEGVRQGIVCEGGETDKTIIEGLKLTNCYASRGAGIYCTSSSPTVTNCIFTNNTVDYQGGGIYGGSTITNCTFENNFASWGGGMYNWGTGLINNCTFRNNVAEKGGGMYNVSANVTITDCEFENNSASETGGGMHNYSSTHSIIENCAFTNNHANSNGGGIYNRLNCTTLLIDCTLIDNSSNQFGDSIYAQLSEVQFGGTNACGDIYVEANYPTIGNVGTLTFLSNSVTNVAGIVRVSQDAVTSFDLDELDAAPLLSLDLGFIEAGSLSLTNDSGSLIAVYPGDTIPIAQAPAFVGGFECIVFPPMPDGLGLQLIEQPATRGGDVVDELAVNVIEIEGANFGDPFSGDLDSPPIDIISFDADGDGRDEVAVLFGGTPGAVAAFSVAEDGTPTPIDGLVANAGNDPVSIDAADLNSDGFDDLVVANSIDNSISVLLTMEDVNGSLYFDVSTMAIPGSNQSVTCVAAIDWDGDDSLDAVVGVDIADETLEDGYQVLLDIASGSPSTGPWLEIAKYEVSTGTYIADPPTCVDGGIQSDDWGFVGGTRYGRVHRGISGGSLQVISELAGNNTVTIEAIELDANGGDGQIDLMVSSDEDETIYLFQGDVSESDNFVDSILLSVSLPVEDVIALDADDDGDMDIVMTAPDSDTPVILLRNDGTSGGLLPSSLGGQTWSMQVINSASDVIRLTSGGLSLRTMRMTGLLAVEVRRLFAVKPLSDRTIKHLAWFTM